MLMYVGAEEAIHNTDDHDTKTPDILTIPAATGELCIYILYACTYVHTQRISLQQSTVTHVPYRNISALLVLEQQTKHCNLSAQV